MEIKNKKLEKVMVTDKPSQIEKIAKYDGMRPNETHVSTAQVPHSRYGNVYVHHFSSDDGTNARHLVSMFHDPTKLGVSILLAARENEDEPMRVYAAATHPDFRGNRLNYLALKEAVKSHGKLYSDVMQTKGAFKNWTSLQKEPGFKVNMTKPFREGSAEDASLQSHIAQYSKAKSMEKTERLKKAPIMNEGNQWHDPVKTSLGVHEIEAIKEGISKNHKVKTFNLSNNLYHHVIISNNNFAEHIISDNENPFAEGITRVAGEVNKNGHLVIGSSQTRPYYQNKGYGKLAYTQALKYHNGLISDVDLSHTANSIWKHLKTLPDVNVSFGKKGTSQRHFATLKNPNNMEKAVTPEQQKENIKKQRQLKNKEIIAKLKSKIVDKESPTAPSVKPHLLMSEDDSPYGIPVYLKTHKDHDSLVGVHVHVSKLPELKNYGLLNHPEIDKALDRAEEKGHKAVYVSVDSKPTVEIQPHPEDVIDVDPEILESMKERLKSQKPKSHLKLIKALIKPPKIEYGQYTEPFSMGGTKKDKKTIYSHFEHPEHAHFNAQEHLDAYWRHQEKIKQNPKMESSLVNFHKKQAQQHWNKSRDLVDAGDTSRRAEENKLG